jgi:hypothetical protein
MNALTLLSPAGIPSQYRRRQSTRKHFAFCQQKTWKFSLRNVEAAAKDF